MIIEFVPISKQRFYIYADGKQFLDIELGEAAWPLPNETKKKLAQAIKTAIENTLGPMTTVAPVKQESLFG